MDARRALEVNFLAAAMNGPGTRCTMLMLGALFATERNALGPFDWRRLLLADTREVLTVLASPRAACLDGCILMMKAWDEDLVGI